MILIIPMKVAKWFNSPSDKCAKNIKIHSKKTILAHYTQKTQTQTEHTVHMHLL